MTVVIGKNGVGKSALFDAFGFLGDALKSGVEEACDARGRGGFEKIRTQGQADPIEFEVLYREHENEPLFIYKISIDIDKKSALMCYMNICSKSDKKLPVLFLL